MNSFHIFSGFIIYIYEIIEIRHHFCISKKNYLDVSLVEIQYGGTSPYFSINSLILFARNSVFSII